MVPSDQRKTRLQDNLIQGGTHRKQGATLKVHHIRQFRNHFIENLRQLHPATGPQLEKNMVYNGFPLFSDSVQIQNFFVGDDKTEPFGHGVGGFDFKTAELSLTVLVIELNDTQRIPFSGKKTGNSEGNGHQRVEALLNNGLFIVI